MSLLRKNTVPEGPMQYPPRRQQIRSKACSQINLFQLGNHLFGSGAGCKNGRTLGQRGKHNGGCLSQEKPLTKQDMEVIVSKNSLTVNFGDRNAVDALPALTSFGKIKGILIKKPIFERFKEFNKQNGAYREELEELSREEELQRYTIQVRLASAISQKGQEEFLNHFPPINLHPLETWTVAKDILGILLQKLENVRNSLEKWRVGYFHQQLLRIAQEQVEDGACSQACEDDHIERSIDLFAKFSQKMGEGLLRKRKRLQKVFQYRV